jgi:hypothetical protein
MKNLEYQLFEKIIFTFQDQTGFEETAEFPQTWYLAVYLELSQIKRDMIKEVRFINPIMKEEKNRSSQERSYSVKCKGCGDLIIYQSKDIIQGSFSGESVIECQDCKTLITVEDLP